MDYRTMIFNALPPAARERVKLRRKRLALAADAQITAWLARDESKER